MKMKKVEEPIYGERFCDRCEENHCENCIDFVEVDFEIKEIVNENHPNPNAERFEVKWKGNEVCPWCYNQLVDKVVDSKKSTTPRKGVN